MCRNQVLQEKLNHTEHNTLVNMQSTGQLVGFRRRVTELFDLQDIPGNTEKLKWKICCDNKGITPHFSLWKHRWLLSDLKVIAEIMDGDMTRVISGGNYYLCASNRHSPGSFKLSIFACFSKSDKELAPHSVKSE